MLLLFYHFCLYRLRFKLAMGAEKGRENPITKRIEWLKSLPVSTLRSTATL